jgi:diadenosine tetraphosphate (Ap4A) HIT family hydrolase
VQFVQSVVKINSQIVAEEELLILISNEPLGIHCIFVPVEMTRYFHDLRAWHVVELFEVLQVSHELGLEGVFFEDLVANTRV